MKQNTELEIVKRVVMVAWIAALTSWIIVTAQKTKTYDTTRERVEAPTVATIPKGGAGDATLSTVTNTTRCEISDEVQNHFDLLARCVYAEAGNQPEEGIRACVDVIRNRVNDVRFPDTIEEVIYQPRQFSVVSYGAIWAIDVTDEMIDLIADEWTTDAPVLSETVIYFNNAPIGSNVIKIGDHYFGE